MDFLNGEVEALRHDLLHDRIGALAVIYTAHAQAYRPILIHLQ